MSKWIRYAHLAKMLFEAFIEWLQKYPAPKEEEEQGIEDAKFTVYGPDGKPQS